MIVLHQLATLVSRPLDYAFTSYTSLVFVFILYFMFPFGLVTRAALTLSVGEIVFVLLFKEYEPGGKFTLVIAHIFANLLGAFWSASANTIKRKSYLDFIVLKKAKARIDFMYRVPSHDVRAPFSALISQSGLLKQSLDTGNYPKSQELAASMGAMIQQSYLMTENLLEWGGRVGKQARAKQVQVDLVELVSDTVAMFRPLLEQKGLHLEMRLERRATLRLDARAFQVIIRNLVHNACKYSPEGSELRLSMTRGTELISIELFNQGKP
ncbi:MAG: sensor histidine kinase, partial [Rectinemataceae bacterium]